MQSDLNTGIYAIEHIASGKVYIGSATKFNTRWNTHRSFLRSNNHHCRHLQDAWNKYGDSAFEFKKLVVCSQKNLITYEQLLIDGYKAADRKHGYNARQKAESVLGMRHSLESREKMSRSQTGRKASPETKALLSSMRKGKKMPEWFPESVSKRMKGFKHSDATKAVISTKGIGRPVSLHTREKKSKLTLVQVNEIRARYQAGGITQTALGIEYALNPSTISLLLSGKRWAICSLDFKENLK